MKRVDYSVFVKTISERSCADKSPKNSIQAKEQAEDWGVNNQQKQSGNPTLLCELLHPLPLQRLKLDIIMTLHG